MHLYLAMLLAEAAATSAGNDATGHLANIFLMIASAAGAGFATYNALAPKLKKIGEKTEEVADKEAPRIHGSIEHGNTLLESVRRRMEEDARRHDERFLRIEDRIDTLQEGQNGLHEGVRDIQSFLIRIQKEIMDNRNGHGRPRE